MAAVLAGAIPLAAMLVVLWTQFHVRRTFAKHAEVASEFGRPAHLAARYLLAAAGLNDVNVTSTPGSLNDHYDPEGHELRLSSATYQDQSVAAIAVAAHEVGHAMQDSLGHLLFRLRLTLARATSAAAAVAPFIMIGGLVGGLATRHPTAFAIAAFGVVVLLLAFALTVVALPIEFDASRRAQRLLEVTGITTVDERTIVRDVLDAAAWTYLASLLGTFARVLLLAVRLLGRFR